MKILLATTPWTYYELRRPGAVPPQRLTRMSDASGQGALPPYGLLILAGALRREGHDVTLIDGYFKSSDTLLRAVRDLSPGIIGISAPTCLWPRTAVLAKELRTAVPKAYLVLGGPHASVMPARCLIDAPALDAVVPGPGETVLCELAARLAAGEKRPLVPGMISRAGDYCPAPGESAATGPVPPSAVPAWDLIDPADYVPNLPFSGPLPFMHTFTSFGCPRRCVFCASGGRPRHERTPDDIVEEIVRVRRLFGTRTVNFYDDANIFSEGGERAFELCRLLRSLPFPVSWSTYLSAFDVPQALFAEMKAAGCFMITAMIESGVEKNRTAISRNSFTNASVCDTIRDIRRSGIAVSGRFQFGAPGETPDEGMKTVDFAASLPLDFAYFLRLLLVPGSAAFETYRATGNIDRDMRRWNAYNDFFTPDAMTRRDMTRLIRTGYLRFYGRPSLWARHLCAVDRYTTYLRYLRRVAAAASTR